MTYMKYRAQGWLSVLSLDGISVHHRAHTHMHTNTHTQYVQFSQTMCFWIGAGYLRKPT